MRKFITSILATAITATSAFAIDLSGPITYPTPAPVIEHNLPHIEWDRDAHNKFFDLVMESVMDDEDLDPNYTTKMLVDAVKCMDEAFSSDYSFARFLGEWDNPSDTFLMQMDLATEFCFVASYTLHSNKKDVKYY
jgi:hypothetical protein